MSKYTRQYDFQPDTTIMSGQVDEELNAVKVALDDHIDKTPIEHPNASITTPKLDAILTSGWMTAEETWTYASATTFTISGDKTGKYQIGDKIKLTQTTVKYFNIITVSYSSPNTTITITGGTSYTLINAAIISPFYSKIENPQGFPHWFNWTPTYGALDAMTYTSVTTSLAKFKVIGKSVYFKLRCVGTTGGTASPSLTFTLSINCADDTTDYIGGGCWVYDVAYKGGLWRNQSASVIAVYKYDTSNYGLGANRYLMVQGFYRIA